MGGLRQGQKKTSASSGDGGVLGQVLIETGGVRSPYPLPASPGRI